MRVLTDSLCSAGRARANETGPDSIAPAVFELRLPGCRGRTIALRHVQCGLNALFKLASATVGRHYFGSEKKYEIFVS